MPETVSTPEIRFPCSEERKFSAVEEVKANLDGVSGIEVNAVDGVRVTSEDGWWLLRASNTQDVLVARAEANDKAALDRLKALLRGALEKVGVAVPEF